MWLSLPQKLVALSVYALEFGVMIAIGTAAGIWISSKKYKQRAALDE
jgi:hypothetical protein